MESTPKNYVSLEEYNELKEKYEQVESELWGIKNRKYYRALQKLGRIMKKLRLDKITHFINRCTSHAMKITGILPGMYHDMIINHINKLTLPEYKYYRFKKNRMKDYYIDHKKIKHSYEKDLVSIVLPIYNGEKLVGQTLDSILRQTYSNFELIIVNDGSTDNTLNILKKYAKKDKRIRIIDQENQKLPQSIANGMKYANGEYCMWVGGDDILHDDCVEKLVLDLKAQPNVDLVFPNVRLIDENGNIITKNRWYATNEEHPEYVMLPKNMLEFSVLKNNYIAPIAMFRSIVTKTLSPWSKNRFTTEDYDYWIRVNDNFVIAHTLFDEPIFDYRRHSGSLTSHNKELNIAEKTNELLLFEDFRQDFYLMPLIWVLNGNEEIKEYQLLKSYIEEKNHVLFTKEEAQKLKLNRVYNNLVYIDFCAKDEVCDEVNGAYKIAVTNHMFTPKKANYDFYISTDRNAKEKEIDHEKGWFQIEDISTLFSFIDTKAKDMMLRRIEDEAMSEKEESLKLSAIICTYKRTDNLVNVLNSLLTQTEDRKNFEILVVNNDYKNQELLDLVNALKKKHHLKEDFIRYIEAPIKGLSYARNVGLWESRGNVLLYLDDDSLATENTIEETIKAYENNPNAGVIGGNIILKKPNPIPEVLIEGKEGFWSQYLVKSDKDKIVNEWYEFPYGANFSTRKKDLKMVGGFRVTYGRQGHNYLGGEEVVVASLIQQLGRSVVVAPKSIVYHDVNANRYTKEHVIKTTLSGSLTRLKMEEDLMIRPDVHNIDASKREIRYLKSQKRKTKDKMERFYYECQIKANKEMLKQMKRHLNEQIRVTKYRKSMTNFIEK